MDVKRREAGDNDMANSELCPTPGLKHAASGHVTNNVGHISETTPNSLAEDMVGVCMKDETHVTCSAPAIAQTPALEKSSDETPTFLANDETPKVEDVATSESVEALPVRGGGYSLDFRKQPVDVKALSSGEVGVATSKVGVPNGEVGVVNGETGGAVMEADELVQKRQHVTSWEPVSPVVTSYISK